jgi:hypothetical protein
MSAAEATPAIARNSRRRVGMLANNLVSASKRLASIEQSPVLQKMDREDAVECAGTFRGSRGGNAHREKVTQD